MKNASERQKVLLLHGWGSSHRSWAKFREILSHKGIDVIVPDMPGFGDNPPPEKAWHGPDYENWVLEFIKNNHFTIPIILMGHSFGGGLSMKIAIQHSELVDKLVLIAAARMYVKKSVYKKIISRIAKLGKKISPFIPFFDAVRKVFYRFIVRETDYTRTSGVMKETFVNVIKEDVTNIVHKINVPTLIVWGDKDKATPVEHARLLNERITGSQLEIIKGCGHPLNLECPEKLAEIVYKFVKGR